MIMRTLFGMFALAGVCLVGCTSDDKKNDDAKDKSTKTEAKDDNRQPEQIKQPEPVENANYEPYDAKTWRPDPGKADPNAWKPQDSKATKAGSAIFNALKRAVTGSGDEAEKQP
jgi:hypothetical protein